MIQVQEEQNNKAAKIKDLVTQVDNFAKENLDHVKEVTTRAAAGPIASTYLMRKELAMVQRHKQLMRDFVFAEMREHAKLLEHYSRLFEETTMRVNIQKEFADTMSVESKFPPNEI